MTPKQKIELRRSEIRSRLAEISALEGETFTAEIRGENERLLSELETSEPRLRAAIAAEDAETRHRGDQAGGDGESAEKRALVARARLGAFVRESWRQGGLTGAEAELRAATFGTGGGEGLIPWAAIAPRRPEHRADVSTSVSANAAAEQFSFVERVFADGASAFCGVTMPTVARGTAAFPVLSDGANPGMVAKGAAKDAEAATVTVQSLEPRRLAARYKFRVEDLARIDDLEMALRRDISAALSEAMDGQVIGGDGNAPNVMGLVSGITAPDVPSVRTAFGSFIGVAADAVDGRHARDIMEVRLLCAVDAYQFGAKLLNADNSVIAIPYLVAHSGGVRGTTHIANAPTSGARANIGEILRVRTMAPQSAVAPVWEGAAMSIRDEVTSAATGEVILTVYALWNFTKLRADAYDRASIKMTD